MSITLPPHLNSSHTADALRARDIEVARVVLEGAAVASWMHFCDTCIANKLPPAYYEKWCATSRIRALEVRHHE